MLFCSKNNPPIPRPCSLPPPTVLSTTQRHVSLNDQQPSLEDADPSDVEQDEQEEQEEQDEQEEEPEVVPRKGMFSLKIALQGVESRRSPTYLFQYADSSALEMEINEFFSLPADLDSVKDGVALNGEDVAFNDDDVAFNDDDDVALSGQDKKKKKKQGYATRWIDQLESNDTLIRMKALKQLFYFAFGTPNKHSTTSSHLNAITENTRILLELGILSPLFNLLKLSSSLLDDASSSTSSGAFDTESFAEESGEDADNAFTETGLALGILFLVLECCAPDMRAEVGDALMRTDPPVPIYLFELVTQLAEGIRKRYPIKKLMLLLWKSLLIVIGNTSELRDIKNVARIQAGLPPVDFNNLYTKCTPTDYASLYETLSRKYPTYVLPTPTELFAHFPKPIQRKLSTIERPVVQPFVDTETVLPQSLVDVIDVCRRNLYVSLESVQLSKEMEYDDTSVSNDTRESEHVQNEQQNGHPETDAERGLQRLHLLTTTIIDKLPLYISVLIKLLYYINIGATPPEETDGEYDRHREVVTKAVVGILLLLSKGTKVVHTLVGEYVMQQMMDGNAAVLILKLLSNWFPVEEKESADSKKDEAEKDKKNKQDNGWCDYRDESGIDILVACKNDIYAKTDETKDNDGEQPKDNDDSEKDIDNGAEETEPPSQSQPKEKKSNTKVKVKSSSWRNMYTTINLLRLLHKMTSNKPHRILNLVKWKSSAVLKRILKIQNQQLHLYALKLLKSQIPVLGKKWRNNNMKVVSSVYLSLRPEIRERWLVESEVDVEAALAQEQELRVLIMRYLNRTYPELFKEAADKNPKHERAQSSTSSSSLGIHMYPEPHLSSAVHPSSNQFYTGKAFASGLDQHFIENYEMWLEHEVFDREVAQLHHSRHYSHMEATELIHWWETKSPPSYADNHHNYSHNHSHREEEESKSPVDVDIVSNTKEKWLFSPQKSVDRRVLLDYEDDDEDEGDSEICPTGQSRTLLELKPLRPDEPFLRVDEEDMLGITPPMDSMYLG